MNQEEYSSDKSPEHGPVVLPQIINKKKHKLTMVKLYDNMISASYTWENGQLNQDKIIQQLHSFSKK